MMNKLTKSCLVVLFCLVAWSAAPSIQARENPQQPAADLDKALEPQVLTLEIRAGGETATVRVVEGRPAKLTHQETGEELLLTAIRQPSGEMALEVVESEAGRDPMARSLLMALPLRQGALQVLESSQRQRLEVELVPRRPGQLKATSKLIAPDDSEGEQMTAKQCCVYCDGWKFCACGVDTSCGSCCQGWCCDFM